MSNKRFGAPVAAFLTALGLAVVCTSHAQTTRVEVRIDAGRSGPVINKDIYGQFAEHLGRGIYEGIWVGEDADIPNTRGFRTDVIEALRAIKVPVVRWPGGCFADEYHWRDGIGPREQRPVKVNTNWGGVVETNAFGTHEFFDLVELLGADAYVNGNVGSGTVREMAEWVEYMTSDKDSTLANDRRRNGREKPWDIAYFGIGNETWGCGGQMRPEYYADLYRRYAAFIKTPPGKRPRLVASGHHGEHTEWTEVLSAAIPARGMAGISHHYYTLPTGEWETKGASTGFDESEWFSTMERAYRIDGYIRANIAVLDKNHPDDDTALYIDEWGTWYDPEPGREPGFLYQQNTLRDALVAALSFNIFHQHARRVRMTNIAQMVNVLQAMILTDGPKMLRTPTYYVYGMYTVFQDATSLPFEIGSGRYEMGDLGLPAVTASAARGANGKLYLALANLNPRNPAAVNVSLQGAEAARAVGQVLTADAMDARNTFEAPNAVHPVAFEADLDALEVPPKSVVVVELR
jgi:alpha-N-arabinofuranosidase